MTNKNNAEDAFQTSEYIEEFDNAHAMLMLIAWAALVVFSLFALVCTAIFSDQSGAALNGLVEAAKNIF
jgi:hypothetical protein